MKKERKLILASALKRTESDTNQHYSLARPYAVRKASNQCLPFSRGDCAVALSYLEAHHCG